MYLKLLYKHLICLYNLKLIFQLVEHVHIHINYYYYKINLICTICKAFLHFKI